MYIALDMQNMRPIFKHLSSHACINLGLMGAPNVALAFRPIENASFSRDSDMELKMLFRAMTETPCLIHDRNHIITQIVELLNALPMTDCDVNELEIQANSIDQNSSIPYAYIKGSKLPMAMPEGWLPKALTAKVGQPAIDIPQDLFTKFQNAKAEVAPTDLSAVPDRPKSGATARVWEVADAVYKESGTTLDLKAIRALAKERLVAIGINEGTISVQLGKWAKNI